MEKDPNEMPKIIVIDVQKLIEPEYYEKELIEGADIQLLQSINRNGIKSAIVINRYPGRENIIINGVKVVNACKELGITKIIACVVHVPLEEEKELHFTLNNPVAKIEDKALRDLLNKTYLEYFPEIEFDERDRAAMADRTPIRQTPMGKRLTAITSRVNSEERDKFKLAKEKLGCKSDSEAVKRLIEYYLIGEGLQ